jgi:hypothetical protein
MSWFEQLTGVSESSSEHVHRNLTVSGQTLISKVNGAKWDIGQLETPTLSELRTRVAAIKTRGTLSIGEVIADVSALHVDPVNSTAFFQVASQFNLLEMTSPKISPEAGVGIYENDRTQGPACAIACGAGTIYRNYFVPIAGQLGQTEGRQLDCIADLGAALGNDNESLWRMQNGYALASAAGLRKIAQRLDTATETERDALRTCLRIGLQWHTQVTLAQDQRQSAQTVSQRVTQAYCSALPVAYSSETSERWQAFARLVLEASYEATLCAAVLNRHATGNNRVFLTLLGGGVFGNAPIWIIDAIKRAIECFREHDLQIVVVSHRTPNALLRRLWQTCEP